MKQKKAFYALALALLLALSLSACGNDDSAAGNGSLPPTAGGSVSSMPRNTASSPAPEQESAQPAAAVMELKICTVQRNGFCGVGASEPYEQVYSICGAGLSEPYGEVYTFSCAKAQLSGAEAPLPGMVVEVGFDGTVLETWPAQIQTDSVTVKEQQTDYFSLYNQILEDLLAQDEALNSHAAYFGFDFTELDALTDSEKQLLAWNFSTAHSAEPLQGTLRELMDEGYIDEESLYWEDGVHFTIKEEKVEQSTVTYSVTKWRSGLGAIGYTNTASQDKHGEWVFQEISNMWIS